MLEHNVYNNIVNGIVSEGIGEIAARRWAEKLGEYDRHATKVIGAFAYWHHDKHCIKYLDLDNNIMTFLFNVRG
tara:strand:+ start:694 stop:915 length:222 start_codon:yes stop_codon:yes gene_type:complete